MNVDEHMCWTADYLALTDRRIDQGGDGPERRAM